MAPLLDEGLDVQILSKPKDAVVMDLLLESMVPLSYYTLVDFNGIRKSPCQNNLAIRIKLQM